jgi:hypothetical protein
MARSLEWNFDYPARYEVVPLDRIDRSDCKKVYSYPAAGPVPTWQEMADRPILEIRPAHGPPWVGVFFGGQYGSPASAHGQLIGWPDEVSFCLVYAGGADVVRSDDPTQTYEIETVHPITDVLSIPHQEIVVFADFTNATAYGADGRVWTSPRLALDELAFTSAEADVIYATGFFGDRSKVPIEIDVRTGRPLKPLPLDLTD